MWRVHWAPPMSCVSSPYRVYASNSWAILETDPDLASISADAVTDADIYDACVAVVAAMNLAEEIGAGEFRAALISIGNAQRRLGSGAEGGPDHA